MIPYRPYLLKAFRQWIEDNGMTPHLVVAVGGDGIRIPPLPAPEGRVILDLNQKATRSLAIGEHGVEAEMRFGGRPFAVRIPLASCLGIFAAETGVGMWFPDEPGLYAGGLTAPPPVEPSPTGRPSLRVVK
jgi:stringent starvation protein B